MITMAEKCVITIYQKPYFGFKNHKYEFGSKRVQMEFKKYIGKNIFIKQYFGKNFFMAFLEIYK
jgi:hypothetical protein